MIKLIQWLFNHDKIADQQNIIELYKQRNKQLEKYRKRCEDAELKVKCLKMYIDDDEALIELFEAAKERDRQIRAGHDQRCHLANMAAQGQANCFNGLGSGVQSNLMGGRYL